MTDIAYRSLAVGSILTRIPEHSHSRDSMFSIKFYIFLQLLIGLGLFRHAFICKRKWSKVSYDVKPCILHEFEVLFTSAKLIKAHCRRSKRYCCTNEKF